jgi:hypothetical protein
MRVGTKENFYFSSRLIWAAFLISFPWFVLADLDSINPHRDWSGIPCALSGVASLTLLAYSWVRGERQMLFLLIAFVFAALTAVLPLVDVGNPGHNHSIQRMRASRSGHSQVGALVRLARTADAERSALTPS